MSEIFALTKKSTDRNSETAESSYIIVPTLPLFAFTRINSGLERKEFRRKSLKFFALRKVI